MARKKKIEVQDEQKQPYEALRFEPAGPKLTIHGNNGDVHVIALERIGGYVNGKGELPEDVKRWIIKNYYYDYCHENNLVEFYDD